MIAHKDLEFYCNTSELRFYKSSIWTSEEIKALIEVSTRHRGVTITNGLSSLVAKKERKLVDFIIFGRINVFPTPRFLEEFIVQRSGLKLEYT